MTRRRHQLSKFTVKRSAALLPRCGTVCRSRYRDHMRRREFISLIGGAVTAWPFAAWGKMRRIGVLMKNAADDPEATSPITGLLQVLEEAGWAVGRNVAIDVRWAAGDVELMKRFVKEFVALEPDLIFTSSTPATPAMLQATRPIPVVFALV